MNSLEFGNRPPELLAILGLGDALREARLADADRLRRDVDAAAFDNLARNLESLVQSAEQIFLGHAAIAQQDVDGFARAKAQHFVGVADGEARRVGVDDECRQAVATF